MKYRLGAIVMAVIAVSALMGTSAFTTATLTRDVDVPVVADNNGIVGIEDNSRGDVIGINQSTNEINVDFDNNTQGANVNTTFEFGNTSVGTSLSSVTAADTAINITNEDQATHDVNISVSSNSAEATVTVYLFNSGASTVKTITEGSSGTITNIGSSGTVYLAIKVQTGAKAGASETITVTVS